MMIARLLALGASERVGSRASPERTLVKEFAVLPARLPLEPWRLLALKLLKLRPEPPRIRFQLNLDLHTQQPQVTCGMYVRGLPIECRELVQEKIVGGLSCVST
jgi:hypothetical protein